MFIFIYDIDLYESKQKILPEFQQPLFLYLGATDLTAVGESGDGQALATTTTTDSTAINAYNDGGTMYFYSGDEMVSIRNCFIIGNHFKLNAGHF